MADITATEAARRLSDLLDAVEHHGEQFTIVRRGKAVAHLEPIEQGRGRQIKEVLGRHRPDDGWTTDLSEVRALLELDS